MKLTLPFLGERPYLHGTTLLDALLECAKPSAPFSFKIEKPVLSNRVEMTEIGGGHAAVVSWGGASCFVKELPPALPITRERFDERALARHVEKRGEGFLLPVDAAPPLRGMVAAFKHVLFTHYPVPARSGHWAFVRLDAERSWGDTFSCLVLQRIFCRGGMASCSVFFDDAPAAVLYFAWADF